MEVNCLEISDKLCKVLDRDASALVGKHLKRLELLAESGEVDVELYKKLSKELIYEHYRSLKTLLRNLLIPSITFVNKE